MDFPRILKQHQYKLHMSNEAFAKYLGKSRTWLQGIYTKNPKIRKFLLAEMTMYELNETLGIDMECMEEYNKQMLERYQEQLKDKE